MSESAPPRDHGYGGFRLGGMDLALPMAALREVVPRGPLTSLPSPARCVIGGINLRGVVVPVVDLRIVLGRETPAQALPNVIIMVHEGRILGLLADSVSAVFTAGPHALNAVSTADDVAAIFSGSVRREDDDVLVSVLSPQALARLPQVPMVQDPEPDRQQTPADAALATTEAMHRPVMLFRCGSVALAIDAMAVHTTLADPQTAPSVLARGHCQGVIAYAGQIIPIVDLLGLCGLGQSDPTAQRRQAFVLRIGQGLVALLIEAVVDIVPIQPADVIALPHFMLGQSNLFSGALPLGDTTPYLLLDSQALQAHTELVALASMNQAGAEPAPSSTTDRQSMLTYALNGETATPLEQVSEILPYVPSMATLSTGGPTLGVLVNRGRSIPLLCLNQMLGGGPATPTDQTTVLVVESEGEHLGFIVPGLKAIETARWEPSVRGAGQTQKLALVGTGSTERMVPVLDLWGVARSLQSPCTAQAR